jgi:hypothetical protein
VLFVPDTTVLITAAITPSGGAGKLLHYAREGRIEIALSPKLHYERANAQHRLEGAPDNTYTQCSDPPGLIRSSAPSTAAAAPLPTPPPEAAPAVDADQVYRNFVMGIPDLTITNWGIMETGAHGICAYLGQGHTHNDATQLVLQGNNTVTAWQASALVNAATIAYCPLR